MKKIALYKDLEYGWNQIGDVDIYKDAKTHVRISEIIEIEFEMLPEVDLVTAQINALKETKQKIQAECEVKLQAVDKKISELLAITYEV